MGGSTRSSDVLECCQCAVKVLQGFTNVAGPFPCHLVVIQAEDKRRMGGRSGRGVTWQPTCSWLQSLRVFVLEVLQSGVYFQHLGECLGTLVTNVVASEPVGAQEQGFRTNLHGSGAAAPHLRLSKLGCCARALASSCTSVSRSMV